MAAIFVHGHWKTSKKKRKEPPLQPIERFYESVARNPDAVAVAGAARGDVTYRELAREVAALACAYQALDGVAGSRVGICLENTYEHLVALLATYAAGKVWVPLSPRNARTALDAMLTATRPSILMDDAAKVRAMIAEYPG
jgi:fatty-acyl-CoA synthase